MAHGVEERACLGAGRRYVARMLTTLRSATLVVLLATLAGCAKNADAMYTHLSAGSTGCEPNQMVLAPEPNPFVWKVTCQGKTFACTSQKGAPQGPAICVAE